MHNKFEFTETEYQDFIKVVELENKIQLTEFESGLCRALLDVRKRLGNKAGAAIGKTFKTAIKRLIDKGLIHKDTYKFTGMAVPTGNLSNTISEFLTFNEVTA